MNPCKFQLESSDGKRDKYYCPVCDLFVAVRAGTTPMAQCDPEQVKKAEAAKQATPVRPVRKITIPDPEREAKRKAAAEKQAVDALAGAEALGDLSLATKGAHYAVALARWFRAGCPRRSPEDAAACEAICRTNKCGAFDAVAVACKICGCSISAGRWTIASKTKMATENCPKRMWPKK